MLAVDSEDTDKGIIGMIHMKPTHRIRKNWDLFASHRPVISLDVARL